MLKPYMSYPEKQLKIQLGNSVPTLQTWGGWGGNGRKEAKENGSVKKTGKSYLLLV